MKGVDIGHWGESSDLLWFTMQYFNLIPTLQPSAYPPACTILDYSQILFIT